MHIDTQIEIAMAMSSIHGHALAAQTQNGTGLCAGRNGHLECTFQCRHGDLVAEYGAGERNALDAPEIGVLALEAGIGLRVHYHVEIAGDTVRLGTGHAVARDTQRSALLDTGGDAHLERLRMLHTLLAVTLLARVIDDRAEALAGGAGDHLLDEDILLLTAAQHLPAAATAGFTGARFAAGFGP